MTLAIQFLDQLKPEVTSAILGNVGTHISFRVGHTDAQILAPDFDIHTRMLTDQSPFHARMKCDLNLHSLATVPFEPGTTNRTESIITQSRRRFSRS